MTGTLYTNQHGTSVLKWNEHIAITDYNDTHRQLFTTTEKCFIFDKEKNKVYEITLHVYNKCLVEIESVKNESAIKYAGTNNL